MSTAIVKGTSPVKFRALESLADFNSGFWRKGEPIRPEVARKLIRDVAQGSETVDGILRHMTDDVANAGYRFVAAPGVKAPSQPQLKTLQDFFSTPNPEDRADEWLENFVWDLILFGDAFWEKVGSKDLSMNKSNEVLPLGESGLLNEFGGKLIGIFHVDATYMFIIANDETGQMSILPGDMCFEQKIGQKKKRFDARKIIRASRFKKGRAYGQSPLLSLFNIVAGQINLTGYIGNLYNGNIPRTLVNVGKRSEPEMTRMIDLLQEQLNTAQNAYGMVLVNVPDGYQLNQLMASAESGKFIETLEYFREEICSVFGMPPSKMGWSTAGKIGSQENMDDTYYDNIERIQHKLERVLYNGVIKELGATDWIVKFNRVRPKQIKVESEARAKNARAIQVGRQEGIMSVNESRGLYELDTIDEVWADDPTFPSPTVVSKQPAPPATEPKKGASGELIFREVVDEDWPYTERKSMVQKKTTESQREMNHQRSN